MSIKEIGARLYADGESIQQVVLTVDGNVPKAFPGGTATELTLGRQQALALHEDLIELFGDSSYPPIRNDAWSAPLPELPEGAGHP